MYNAEIGIERSVSISRRRRPHFAPTQNGVRVCGRDRTHSAQRPAQVSCQWTEGTVSLSTAQTIGHVKPSDKITARTGKFQCAIPESPPTHHIFVIFVRTIHKVIALCSVLEIIEKLKIAEEG